MNEVTQYKPSVLEPTLTLTDTARGHVLSYLSKKHGMRGIRFSVKKTGCSGLSYVIDYIEKSEKDDLVMKLANEYIIAVDNKSYPYLKGCQVDYVKQGLNHQFVFSNPNQTGQCGCGESFTVT